jgi:hypothetical protein
VNLTMMLPASTSAASGVNAIAHSGPPAFPVCKERMLISRSRGSLRTQYKPHHQPASL